MFQTFKNLRDLLNVISAFARLESALIDELESQSRRLYALEENQKMAKATRMDYGLRIGKLERASFGKVNAPDKPTEKELVSA